MSATILVVDDDLVLLDGVAGLLALEGFAVKAASDPWDALVAATEPGGIDLLLTDVAMPLLTGPELALRIRSLRPRVPVLFTSAYPHAEAVRTLGVPPDAPFLAKPFSRSALVGAVRSTLGG